ncbi:MAG: endolytic transglycosylase MltG [Candidatus Dormibacteraeota bacterium]|nr:endolytic transglycosylase MltG [Candidatus Dormibacteraeota bacterium]
MRRGEQGRAGIVFAVVALILVLAVAAGGTLLYGRTQLDPPATSAGAPVTITVSSGESVDALIADLDYHGVIRSAFWFGWYARFQGLASKLVAGQFKLDSSMSASFIIQRLEGPPTVAVRTVLLTEGLNAAQMADRVAAAVPGITAAAYLQEVKTGAFTEPFLAGRPPGSSLEGFLFPDTYTVPANATAHDMVELQLADFAKKAEPLFGAMSPQQLYAALTVASIIEREAKFATDRPLVAAVIDNRLHIGMLLEVDSTVIYGLGLKSDVLTQAQLHQDTPYNSYIHAGLPPTPIANPGASSIQAAVTPASTNYLFFVSDGCGHNHYSVTIQQHDQQVAQYLGQPCASPT